MTRQPAEEKRLTAAWPMPREAPVSSIVRCGALGYAGCAIYELIILKGRAADAASRRPRG